MKKISGIIVDPVARRQFPGTLIIDQGRVFDILPDSGVSGPFILPGLIDSHIHIESSMLTPAAFGAKAVCHGTVAVVADPHEIANVLGVAGIDFMIGSGKQVPLKFYFGAPSCVPATGFENSGATLNAREVEALLRRDDIFFLAEMMNFPGVIGRDPEVMAKLAAAAKMGKRVDGHAPGLRGAELAAYVQAGISTDHESGTLDECYEKLALGMQIMLRQGSSARDFEVLHPLISSHPGQCMLCSDDLKPADLARGHINLLVKQALSLGHDLFDILQCACVNPVRHYQLEVGLLQKGDPADFIMVDDLAQMQVRSTWIGGELVSEKGKALFEVARPRAINQFNAAPLTAEQLQVKVRGSQIKVIAVSDGQLVTGAGSHPVPANSVMVEANPETDLLKILVQNRYAPAPPAIAFVRGFGLKRGAMASSIAHDSHNLIAVGTNDTDLARAVNLLEESSGGICFVCGDEEKRMALPVAGLMGLGSCEEMAQSYRAIEQRVKENGCQLQTPFMTMAFLALPVIPTLKITDLGLFDVEKFVLTDLFV
ncbi:adenine deaminase [Thiovibrio frasassiensis]|uniref:Adenine deaminase n=1 Tax=Thiovibrio frasassiensis TaxID=2984131 RepID=A0A9X4RLJ0_9BACT|nr:adenine deaminase [Thiovibrio frasassiensis]MDG4476181.1 adenine deaminase [Thiovibrio frasassiensis]